MSIIKPDSSRGIDLLKVSTLLDSLSKSLCIPYYIRQGCTQSGMSLEEELKEAIAEITEKERQLNAVVGIARILLEGKAKKQKNPSKNLTRSSETEETQLIEKISEPKAYSDIIIEKPLEEKKNSVEIKEEIKSEDASLQTETVLVEEKSLQTDAIEDNQLNSNLNDNSIDIFEEGLRAVVINYEEEILELKGK